MRRSRAELINVTDPSANAKFPPLACGLQVFFSIQSSIGRAVPLPPANQGPPSVTSPTRRVLLVPSVISLTLKPSVEANHSAKKAAPVR